MRRPLVAGNWKMHGTRASVAELVEGLCQLDMPASTDIAVFPSFLHIGQVVAGLSGTDIRIGAQDCAVQVGQSALTGEVSPLQLQDSGCHLVLIGHSERRLQLGDGEEQVVRKFAAAQQAGLTPVLCLGETLEQREAGATLDVVIGQLVSVTAALGETVLNHAVLAYEPVWAIGTGLTATPEQAQAVHAAIRERVMAMDAEIARKIRIIYGGSVKAANAAELFGMPDIDGGLVGGASLDVNEFGAICRAAGM